MVYAEPERFPAVIRKLTFYSNATVYSKDVAVVTSVTSGIKVRTRRRAEKDEPGSASACIS